jgi:DNA-binding MarR family transcriptional regulator
VEHTKTPVEPQPEQLAADLRLVLARLMRRVKRDRAFPLSHGAVLAVVEGEAGLSVSDLASRERVRPQSMAQTVAELESAGYVKREPDPNDGRRAIVVLTEAGAEVIAAERGRREGWLADAIAGALSPEEQQRLAETIPLLERLADR